MISAATQLGRQDPAVRVLRDAGLISEADLQNAEAARAADPQRPELLDHLLGAGAVAVSTAHRVLSEHFRGEAVIDLDHYPRDTETERLLDSETARRLGALPIARTHGAVEIAVCDPFDLAVLAEVQAYLDPELDPQVHLADAHAVYERIAAITLQSDHEPTTFDVGALTQLAATEAGQRDDQASNAIDAQVRRSAVAQLTDRILSEAVREGASDVHIEFFPRFGWVRFRVDGVLREWRRLPPELEQDLVGHIKARASGMDSANRLLPQDGRLTFQVEGRGIRARAVDMRVSTLPTVNGEKAVLRILDNNAQALRLDELGLEGAGLEVVRRAMRQSWGMILVTGPTGSGKSTTLYSILAALARPEVNIVTIEDPVERRVPMVTQTNIRDTKDQSTNLSFAKVLKSVLRQDPNVVMLGEIRDPDTAATAVRAAMTGHLLLSTLHTNDSAGAISRLIDMGVEPYNVAGTVRLVIAQRLVRRICPGCKAAYRPDPALLALALADSDADGMHDVQYVRGVGCDSCNGTGYRSRIGVYEILEVTDPIRRLIAQGRPDLEIADAARADRMQTLRQAGWIRVRNGDTTLDEILHET